MQDHRVEETGKSYPANLASVAGHPAVLYVRGTLVTADERSVAVVGTRRPSPVTRDRAFDIAAHLAELGYTVVSGLACGIDTAAHRGALAGGGRTIAVLGTGLDTVYPPENAELARSIAAAGALVTHFEPGTPIRPENFPARNVVMSGMTLATLVVDAGSVSGARMQARVALEQHRRLFLCSDLVESRDWAYRYAQRERVHVVVDASDIHCVLDAVVGPGAQHALF